MSARLLAVVAALGLGLLAIPRGASAHPLDLGYLRIDAGATTIAIELDVDVELAARVLATAPGEVAPGTLTAPIVRARAAALADATLRSAPLATDAGTCTWSAVTAALRARTVRLAGAATCPRGWRSLHWPLPFVERQPPTFQLLVKVRTPDAAERVLVVDGRHPALDLDGAAPVGVRELVWTGVEHIGAAPGEWHDAAGWKLPDGLDHVLFLLALVLAGGTLLQLVGITTGFTVGHSITLAISALGIARPPASVIEPLIALSIAVVAAEAWTGRLGRHRWQIAAGFGLVHGFGFAGALGELELAPGELLRALLGYNLGVELGQVAIVLVLAPIILLVHRRPRLRAVVIPAIAASICLAGLYWFIERAFG